MSKRSHTVSNDDTPTFLEFLRSFCGQDQPTNIQALNGGPGLTEFVWQDGTGSPVDVSDYPTFHTEATGLGEG